MNIWTLRPCIFLPKIIQMRNTSGIFSINTIFDFFIWLIIRAFCRFNRTITFNKSHLLQVNRGYYWRIRSSQWCRRNGRVFNWKIWEFDDCSWYWKNSITLRGKIVFLSWLIFPLPYHQLKNIILIVRITNCDTFPNTIPRKCQYSPLDKGNGFLHIFEINIDGVQLPCACKW